MTERFCRTEMLIGKAGMEKLSQSRVAVFGLGGVGGHAAEALVRSGIGAIDLIDFDTVSMSNINRQLFATTASVGKYKADVAEERLRDINPECVIRKECRMFLPETADSFPFNEYDYVVDAIDTVSGKIQLIVSCRDAGIPVISSMGAGNKLDPTQFEVADIYETSVCPLARVMRTELKKRGIESLKVVYSRENPIAVDSVTDPASGKKIPGSVSFVPSVVGLILAGEVIKDLAKTGK